MSIFKKNKEVVESGKEPMRNKHNTIESRLEDQTVSLDIPDDEIWTYRVEGLAAPHINKPYKHYTLKKFIFAITIIVAVSLSCYFSVRTVQRDVFEYDSLSDGTYQFSKFGNTGYITEVDIDYVSELVYDSENTDINTNYSFKKDESKVITAVREYAFNCDEKVQVINIGADVLEIDGKSFYSCWALQRIEVDENNPNYCDVDGVLYNKDKTTLICRPCDHDTYLVNKYGYSDERDNDGKRIEPTGEEFEQFKNDVLTYVVPSTVTTIGELAFNYADLIDVYVPEGLKTIETLGFFEIPRLENVYSYKSDDIADTHYVSEEVLGEIYLSLPEGLEYIGSDAFSYNQAMTYMYIPESVTYIGHHAFWDTVYENNDTKELAGITAINVALSEADFDNTELGDQWRPQYNYLLFKKSIDVNYSAERESIQ